jgi:hypothetical protein
MFFSYKNSVADGTVEFGGVGGGGLGEVGGGLAGNKVGLSMPKGRRKVGRAPDQATRALAAMEVNRLKGDC